jgi:hypothetical protein
MTVSVRRPAGRRGGGAVRKSGIARRKTENGTARRSAPPAGHCQGSVPRRWGRTHHTKPEVVDPVERVVPSAAGQVLADIIGSDGVPLVRLTEVFRQAAESRIIVNAHRINQGRPVVIVGQRKAMAIAAKGTPTRRRWSKLKEWLEAAR